MYILLYVCFYRSQSDAGSSTYINEPVYFVERHLRVDALNLPPIESSCLSLHLHCVSYIPGARRASGIKSTNVSLAFENKPNRVCQCCSSLFCQWNGKFSQPATPNNQFEMDVSLNNHFLCKGLELSN